MNTDTIKCRKVEPGHFEQPGDFCIEERAGTAYLYIVFPGMTVPDAIEIKRGAQGGPRVWGWDGNKDAPTLTPSLNLIGVWHGYLKAGVLESC